MKYSLYPMGKNTPRLFLILLLIASITLVGVSRVSAAVTKISLNPAVIQVSAPGEWFTVDVNITDVADLAAWEFKMSYNTTLLDATYVSSSLNTTICTDWVPIDGGVWHPDTYPTIDETNGIVWTGALFPAGLEFNGNGTFVTINFTATAVGNCTLHLYDTTLYDSIFTSIDHDPSDGSVTVISEFSAILVMPLLLVVTLAAALLGKMFWSRKRKDTLTAE